MTALDLAPYDTRLALRAPGLLGDFNRTGVLTAADVHVASRVGQLCGESDEQVLLAAALTVRAVRSGSVCVDLTRVHEQAVGDGEQALDVTGLGWPERGAWRAACAASAMVAVGADGPSDRPLRLVDDLLYLDRYWRQEQTVRSELAVRAARPPAEVDAERLARVLDRLFTVRAADGSWTDRPTPAPDHQRLAAAAAATGSVTVVAGGPGTGKTTTVARLLALLHELSDSPPRIALAAPTGKAAARLAQAVAHESEALRVHGRPSAGPVPASTVHRLLGWKPGSHSRFKHDRENRLPYDVVVVDETSMVSLTLMSRLLEAVRPHARLVLVGDPDQLASVEAGAVLGDLVGRGPRPGPDPRAQLLREVLPEDVDPVDDVLTELGNDVVRLRTTHRFSGTIGRLAESIRLGRADDAVDLLRSGAEDVEFLEIPTLEGRLGDAVASLRADVVATGQALLAAAQAGDASGALRAMDRHRLLCGHRRGPYGVARWAEEVERWLDVAARGHRDAGTWYPGRPLLVTANDRDLELYNGDTGVVVAEPGDDVRVAFGSAEQPRLLQTGRLPAVQTVHAMTVHRGQGSQFRRVSLVLPPVESPLLTRELLYTAVTRAEQHVRVIGTAAAVRRAVERPIVRASGLRRR